jgi:hypothetical protein
MLYFNEKDSVPIQGQFTIFPFKDNEYLVVWKDKNDIERGVAVRYGGISQLKSLLKESGYSQKT